MECEQTSKVLPKSYSEKYLRSTIFERSLMLFILCLIWCCRGVMWIKRGQKKCGGRHDIMPITTTRRPQGVAKPIEVPFWNALSCSSVCVGYGVTGRSSYWMKRGQKKCGGRYDNMPIAPPLGPRCFLPKCCSTGLMAQVMFWKSSGPRRRMLADANKILATPIPEVPGKVSPHLFL